MLFIGIGLPPSFRTGPAVLSTRVLPPSSRIPARTARTLLHTFGNAPRRAFGTPRRRPGMLRRIHGRCLPQNPNQRSSAATLPGTGSSSLDPARCTEPSSSRHVRPGTHSCTRCTHSRNGCTPQYNQCISCLPYCTPLSFVRPLHAAPTLPSCAPHENRPVRFQPYAPLSKNW
jgi:hypothetical protein